MKMSRRCFLASACAAAGALRSMLERFPLRPWESGRRAAASSAGLDKGDAHVEGWRRFMHRYRLMC